MIVGIGTDLVSIDRIAGVLARHGDRFIRRVFAAEEHYSPSPFQGKDGMGDNQCAHYAKRWAAKEAVAKALGVGIDDGVYLRDIVVLRDARGAPRIDLRGGAAAALQKRTGGKDARVHISLSDDAGFALAFVVVEAD